MTGLFESSASGGIGKKEKARPRTRLLLAAEKPGLHVARHDVEDLLWGPRARLRQRRQRLIDQIGRVCGGALSCW